MRTRLFHCSFFRDCATAPPVITTNTTHLHGIWESTGVLFLPQAHSVLCSVWVWNGGELALGIFTKRCSEVIFTSGFLKMMDLVSVWTANRIFPVPVVIPNTISQILWVTFSFLLFIQLLGSSPLSLLCPKVRGWILLGMNLLIIWQSTSAPVTDLLEGRGHFVLRAFTAAPVHMRAHEVQTEEATLWSMNKPLKYLNRP